MARSDGSDLPKEAFEELKSQIKGQVIVKGEVSVEEYKKVIERWNMMHVKEATVVVLVESEDDIVNTIKFVRKHNLDVSISAGRHTYSGPSSGNGLIIDLRKLRDVTIDESKKTVMAGGGCVAGDVEAAAERVGMRAVFGAINATGVGGITTGGGIGNLVSRYGLVCDNLISARVVTADGKIVSCSENENADLFFGIRGGGSNFGIVSQFTYRLYEGANDVYSGMLMYSPDKTDELLSKAQYYYDNISLKYNKAALMLGVAMMHGNATTFAMLFYDGPEEEAKECYKPFFDLGPVMNMAGMKPYTASTDWAQYAALFPPQFNRVCSSNAQIPYPLSPKLLVEAKDLFVELMEKHGEHASISKLLIDLRDYRKVAEVPVNATAYAGRATSAMIAVDLIWDEPSMDAEMLTDARAFTTKMKASVKEDRKATKKDGPALVQTGDGDVNGHPITNGHKATESDEYEGHIASTTLYALLSDGKEKMVNVFGSNLPRLREIKRKYDPDMLFDKWYPIEPAEVNGK